jgi:cell division protein FtsB
MIDNRAKEKNKKFPVLLVVSMGVFVSAILSFFLGQSGILRLRQLEQEYNQIRLENYRLALENKKTADEIRKLRTDPAALEKIAREELHLVSPHDLVLIVQEPEQEKDDNEKTGQ